MVCRIIDYSISSQDYQPMKIMRRAALKPYKSCLIQRHENVYSFIMSSLFACLFLKILIIIFSSATFQLWNDFVVVSSKENNIKHRHNIKRANYHKYTQRQEQPSAMRAWVHHSTVRYETAPQSKLPPLWFNLIWEKNNNKIINKMKRKK